MPRARREIFIVIGPLSGPPSNRVDETVQSYMKAAHTFKKAYNIAISMGWISDPDVSYKGALKRFNKHGHVYLKNKDDDYHGFDDGRVLITKIQIIV